MSTIINNYKGSTPHWPGSIGGGSGTQLGGAIGGDTGSWWSLDDWPDSCLPRPAARKDLLIISLRRSLQAAQNKAWLHWTMYCSQSKQNKLHLHVHLSVQPYCISSYFVNEYIVSLPSTARWACPVPRTVARNHRDCIGNCFNSRQTLGKCVSLRSFSFWNEISLFWSGLTKTTGKQTEK